MSTRGPRADRSYLSEILPPEERAIEDVVARYQRVAGAVTRFARTLAGNDELAVRIGADARSSDDEVIVDPGVFQAAYSRRAPVTPDEVALASALHEVVHLVSSDFDERRELPREWFGPNTDIPDGDFELLDGLNRAGGQPAEALFFAIEDARQEYVGLQEYPGAKSVLSDLYTAATPQALADAGLLGQYTLCCFLMLGGHLERDQLERRVHAKVAGALPDAQPFLDAAAEAEGPWEVGTAAVQLLAVARLHGLATQERSSETVGEKKQRDEHEGEAIREPLDQLRLMTPILGDAESYERTRNATTSRPGESRTRGESQVASDDGTDQLIRVSEAPTVYLPNGQGGKLVIGPLPHRFRQFAPEGRARIQEAIGVWNLDTRHVSGELFPLFAANQRRGLLSGYDSGDLSPHAPLLLAGGLYERMYERRSMRTRRSYAVSLLVDGSASMLQTRPAGSGGRQARWAMASATLGAWMLAALCDELQIDFEVAVFNRNFAAITDDTEESYHRRWSRSTQELQRTQGSSAKRLVSTVNHYEIKPFERRWRSQEDLLSGFFYAASDPRSSGDFVRRNRTTAPPVGMFAKAANVDELNVQHAANRLNGLGAKVRVLVVLADGMTRGSLEALAETVDGVEATGTTVLGIGVGDDTVTRVYARHAVVDRPDSLTTAMVGGVKSALRRSLTLSGEEAWWLRGARPTQPSIFTSRRSA
ncbi:MAG: hypothetical protein HKN46_04845 [Acidimicrobiia bacterium]|nr:hypothetical protein [Acidimicrobiia bacterium]